MKRTACKKVVVCRKVINGTLLLDVTAASALLGCSERSLRARVARQLVPHRRLNSRVVFVREELLAFVQNLPGLTLEAARANAFTRSKGGGGFILIANGPCVSIRCAP